MSLNIYHGVCDKLAREWNKARKKGDKELMKKFEKELWFLRLYCDRAYDNTY